MSSTLWAAVRARALTFVLFRVSDRIAGFAPIELSKVGATKLVYVILNDQPHIMNIATGVSAANIASCCHPECDV
jgi:hypothetical protein